MSHFHSQVQLLSAGAGTQFLSLLSFFATDGNHPSAKSRTDCASLSAWPSPLSTFLPPTKVSNFRSREREKGDWGRLEPVETFPKQVRKSTLRRLHYPLRMSKVCFIAFCIAILEPRAGSTLFWSTKLLANFTKRRRTYILSAVTKSFCVPSAIPN